MKVSIVLALSFLVPTPGVEVSCPSSILQQCNPLTYHDFENIAKDRCHKASIAWRRLVFQETSKLCQGDCDSITLSVPLRSSRGNHHDTAHHCGEHTCHRIQTVIEEICPDDEPSTMDAYDVAYQVSYTSPRPAQYFRRRLGESTTIAVECQDAGSIYYSIAIGMCSGLITTAILLWVIVFHTHLVHRRRRLQRALQMAANETVSSKTSVISSSDEDDDDDSDDDAVPLPTPPELYETSATRPPPIMTHRSSNVEQVHDRIATLLDAILANQPKVTAPVEKSTSRGVGASIDQSSPRGVIEDRPVDGLEDAVSPSTVEQVDL